MYKDDLEEEISQSGAEPVMTMNIPVRNADDVAEFVFALVLTPPGTASTAPAVPSQTPRRTTSV